MPLAIPPLATPAPSNSPAATVPLPQSTIMPLLKRHGHDNGVHTFSVTLNARRQSGDLGYVLRRILQYTGNQQPHYREWLVVLYPRINANRFHRVVQQGIHAERSPTSYGANKTTVRDVTLVGTHLGADSWVADYRSVEHRRHLQGPTTLLELNGVAQSPARIRGFARRFLPKSRSSADSFQWIHRRAGSATGRCE